MVAKDFITRLHGVKETSNGWMACCPAHDDQTQSLHVATGAGGCILVKCFAGCETKDIVKKLGLSMPDLFEKKNGKAPEPFTVEKTYDYFDERGHRLFQVVRKSPKGFYQRHPDKDGNWVNNINGTRRVLYRLPEILASDKTVPVLVVEGEKDADAARDLGFISTTCPQGAGKWRDDYSPNLRDRVVVLIPDNDLPGKNHMEAVAKSLDNIASSIRWIVLPGVKDKGDLSDWIANGGTREELQKLVNNSVPVGQRDIVEETDIEVSQTVQHFSIPRVNWLTQQYVAKCLGRKEKGDAEMFAKLYTDLLAYDHASDIWNMYNGHYWLEDEIGEVIGCVTDGVASQYVHLAAEMRREGKEDADAVEKYAGLLRFKNKVHNILSMASSERGIGLTGNEWDRDPMMFGVENGTLDLKTGELSEGNPKDYIKNTSKVVWSGMDTPAPRWEQFLQEIFDGDIELVSFLQRLLGYGMTGLNVEHIFPVLWGEGRNGKDTLLEIIKLVMGDMATPVSADVLLDNGKNVHGATPHLAAMRGKRLVWVDETNEGARLNVGQVKMLTGGSTVVARPLHSKPITFKPQYLLMLITNHQPHADSDDYALWKRIILLKFTQSFVDNPHPPHEHQRDPYLPVKLEAESSGILAWMVRGCIEWQKNGMGIPDSVRLYTKEYQGAEDTTTLFLEEACIREGEVSASDLYKGYFEWNKMYGSRGMSMTAFGRRMSKRFIKIRKTRGFYYSGLSLRGTSLF